MWQKISGFVYFFGVEKHTQLPVLFLPQGLFNLALVDPRGKIPPPCLYLHCCNPILTILSSRIDSEIRR